jgi:DNA repair exonuclease SbcCD ATPase subunit
MSVKCELCGKEFKNTQGRRGHMTFVHQITSSSSKSAAPLATEQQPSKLEERLQKLESAIGLKESSSLDRILGTDEPITEQLEQHTHQLVELNGQLKSLSQQVQLASSSTEVLNIRKQITQLSEQVGRHNRWLTTSPVMLFLSRNSPDCPAFLLDLNRLKERVNDHQGAINWIRKKFNLVKQGTA